MFPVCSVAYVPGLYRPDVLTVESVRAFLEQNPALVDEWERYAGDKQRGWYFSTQRDKPEIGYADIGISQVKFFDSPLAACAEYIVVEMRDQEAWARAGCLGMIAIIVREILRIPSR